ncbi:metallo-mystery pair system four-Cys motif protein [Oceanobacter sp. 5_MG-2023]|uniref:MbnP family copper-binding protein n=1 Tax=Oceanobacter sp. 5_MG-2023 TaxID=3062645 RepID=UPI0026E377AC|nr:MbnP family copper-binding protein [Oceanobacter sp. 5_MG-2023]MDO6681969.1 metallo-mystery pair system four-Cys motif protein [Oceanobacter sp. 5_MG-2023]
MRIISTTPGTRLLTTLSVMATSVLLASCGSDSSNDSDSDASAETVSYSLQFSASVGAEEMACGEHTTLVGTADDGNGSLPSIKDFRLYVSDVQVATDDGEFVSLTLDSSDWQYENVALLDFEDGSDTCTSSTTAMNSVITGTAPEADYSRVRFTVGVPEDLNHLDSDTAVSPLNISGLHWSWAGGYKHARLDVVDWNIHLGTTGCTLDENNDNLDCTDSRPNRPTYTFSNVTLASSTINFDYAALVADSDITTDEGGATGCMSSATDPECAEIFTNLGLDVTTGQCLDDDCDSQTWVTVE